MRKILLFLTLLASVAFAEDRFYVIDDFSKGLDEQVSEYSMPKGKATVAENVRFNTVYGAISKREGMLSYGAIGYRITGLHRYYKSDANKALLVAGSTYVKLGSDSAGTFTTIADELSDGKRWTWVTYKDIAIGMNGSDNAKKYDGHTQVTANTDGSRTASNLMADLGAPFAELNTGTDLDASSWYQYKVMFYDGTTTYFSNAVSNPILTGAAVYNVYLTGIPIGETGTTARYIYRTEGQATEAALSSATFKLVDTIADNTTTTYADDVADGSLTTTWSETSKSDVTPPTGKYCLIHDERLWITGNGTYLSDVYWSDQFNPDYFLATDYEEIRPDDGDEVTFIKEQLGILTIGKTNTIQKFYTDGSSTTDWVLSDPISFVGCPAPYSAVNTPMGIIYLGRDGLYKFNGQNSQLISDAVTPVIDDILDTNFEECPGVFFNNTYQLAYTSSNSGETANNRVLIYEMVRDAYSIDTKNINCFCKFDSGTDFGTLYSGDSSSAGYVYAHEFNPDILTIRYKSEFDAGTFDDMRSTGTEKRPEMELAWDCTIDGWLTELQTKNALIDTIDEIATYLTTATIDRPDGDGTWVSPVYKIDASDLDQIYWNERLGSYGNVTVSYMACDDSACSGETYETAVSDPTGSDISALAGDTYFRVRANFTSSDTEYSPTLYYDDGYVIKVTYSKSGASAETAIATEWQSGWLDFEVPGHKKWITRIKVVYQGTAGTLNFRYANDEGDFDDSFDIDLSQDPDSDVNDEYTGSGVYKVFTYATPGNTDDNPSPIGQFFKFDITEGGATVWSINRLEIMYSLEEIYD